MHPQPTPADLDAADATRQREDTQSHALVLRELIHVSASLVRLLGQQAADQIDAISRGEAKSGSLPDLTTRYERLSRSIERNILNAQKLTQPIAPPRRPVSEAPSPPPSAAQRDTAQRNKPLTPPREPPAHPRHENLAGPRRDSPHAEPSPAVLENPLNVADFEARLARDVAARTSAAFPRTPQPGVDIRRRQNGTDPP